MFRLKKTVQKNLPAIGQNNRTEGESHSENIKKLEFKYLSHVSFVPETYDC
jgi:hypothetical protein